MCVMAGRIRELRFIFMCMGIWLACMSLHYLHAGYHRGQRGYQIPETELQTIVSHSMGAGN